MGHKVYGARSWLSIAGVNFQPAQLAVIAGIMVLSLFLSQFRQMHPMLRLTLCGAVVGAPCLLILDATGPRRMPHLGPGPGGACFSSVESLCVI